MKNISNKDTLNFNQKMALFFVKIKYFEKTKSALPVVQTQGF